MALFGKRRGGGLVEAVIAGMLDAQDSDVIVVRGKTCELLYLNSAAQVRAGQNAGEAAGTNSRESYCKCFDKLCERCPQNMEHVAKIDAFDVRDAQGRVFSVNGGAVQWLDGLPACVLYLRDVSEERDVTEKLYFLAYHDQLTGAPNRQRLREDFEAVHRDIKAGRAAGVLAVFDLDNFKGINDTYGHNTGDIMLRRLVEHMEADDNFKGHLYRLGGDEFVLLYTGPAACLSGREEIEAHYTGILSGAFLSYTMPNIEMSCTISMGVSAFPAHGDNFSELLRKADIALYQAKAGGRNRMVFFVDKYDTAKKFKDLYINIQPILTPHGRTYGYELVDRGDESAGDGDELNLTEIDRTLDALGLGEMQDGAKYFIAFTPQMLGKTVLNNLPKDKFVVQIPMVGEALPAAQAERYKELVSHGYKLALVNFGEADAASPLLKLARYVKFAPQTDGALRRKLIEENPGNWFVATDVNTTSDFENARRKGYKLFQGFFFNQPVVVKKTKSIDPMRVNYLRLLKLTSTESYVNFHEIAGIISSDVALSYKLLRLLNSAAVGLRNQVSSIDMALAYLGEENLKKWIALLALRGIASNKPLELVRMSLVRARFGELLAPRMAPPRDVRHVFLVGLFSLLHIALEKTKQELFDEIPVADEIRTSLLTESGPYSAMVRFYSAYEYAEWDAVTRFSGANGLPDRLVNESYIAAVKWYNSLAAADKIQPGKADYKG